MDHDPNLPTPAATFALLTHLAPGSTYVGINKLPGSFSNYTYLLEAQAMDGTPQRFVIRLYAVFGDYDRGEKARREFNTYILLRQNNLPAPQPLYLDEAGEVLGSPGIVTSYVPGEMVQLPDDPVAWANAMAITLAQIHAVPCNPGEHTFLLDANEQASWFISKDVIPPYMQTHPMGKEVWQAVHDHFPRLLTTRPGLVHIDYWPGNLLWEGIHISAVVDWEEAAYGDPAIDVAYCRMNMALDDMPQAMDEFLHTYEVQTGRHLPNLAFWELAASARPMVDPVDWDITVPPRTDRFNRFIENALDRLALEF